MVWAVLAAMLLSGSVWAQTDSGAALFKAKCSSCHGVDGSANTPAGKKMEAANLHDKQYVEMSDKDMFESIGRGIHHRNYPHSFLYTGMTEAQVKSLVAHIRVLQKKKLK